ncbi:glycosyl transferase, group 1 [Sulfuriferula multivorans]|uniref:Glycosyl transferase, group 1 n=1 Tax=Sulfuriferula multivorans TaxID=1559896 RepID=A0A401JDW7_9PROT|nr:glycosyltransferase family 4 protein [Sulfuriferula multivorans]GBL45750.1 glycosyl transferase, group 1 [Sulfuriferula multivorans]
MPRYLVLTELFLPTKGGTAVWFAEVYRRLSGKETHIVTADVPGAVEVDASHPNSVHRINMRRVAWLRPESLGMYFNLFFKSLGLALTHRFDAIHAGRALPEGLTAWAVARLTFHPVVIYAHGEELTTWGRGGKYKAMCFALRHADRVIANSEFTRDELIKMDVNPARITLIYPGVDVVRFRPGLACDDLRQSVGVGAAGKLILSVGRLSRRKGFDQVIKSLPALVQAGLDVQYTLIGIGEDQDYLLDLASEHGVVDRVHLLGHVSADDLPRWYNACDVFAMPNREINGDTEGFGMVFIEAAACAKPAVAGTAGGTGAAVIDGMTGMRVDGNELAVTSALHRLLGDPSLARSMGEAGLIRAQAEFAWERVADKTRRLQLQGSQK